MVQAEAENLVETAPKRMMCDKFIEWYPEDSEYRYELHEGLVIVSRILSLNATHFSTLKSSALA